MADVSAPRPKFEMTIRRRIGRHLIRAISAAFSYPVRPDEYEMFHPGRAKSTKV